MLFFLFCKNATDILPIELWLYIANMIDDCEELRKFLSISRELRVALSYELFIAGISKAFPRYADAQTFRERYEMEPNRTEFEALVKQYPPPERSSPNDYEDIIARIDESGNKHGAALVETFVRNATAMCVEYLIDEDRMLAFYRRMRALHIRDMPLTRELFLFAKAALERIFDVYKTPDELSLGGHVHKIPHKWEDDSSLYYDKLSKDGLLVTIDAVDRAEDMNFDGSFSFSCPCKSKNGECFEFIELMPMALLAGNSAFATWIQKTDKVGHTEIAWREFTYSTEAYKSNRADTLLFWYSLSECQAYGEFVGDFEEDYTTFYYDLAMIYIQTGYEPLLQFLKTKGKCFIIQSNDENDTADKIRDIIPKDLAQKIRKRQVVDIFAWAECDMGQVEMTHRILIEVRMGTMFEAGFGIVKYTGRVSSVFKTSHALFIDDEIHLVQRVPCGVNYHILKNVTPRSGAATTALRGHVDTISNDDAFDVDDDTQAIPFLAQEIWDIEKTSVARYHLFPLNQQ